MEEKVFQADIREVIGKQVRALRRSGRLPGVIYGRHIGSLPISLDFREATYKLHGVSSSQLVKVIVNKRDAHTTLVREKQRHPVTGVLLHVDFQAVSLTEKLRAMVTIDMHGEAPAVKEYNGILVTGYEQIEVESLPGDLPERITIDISGLKEIGNAIYVRDLVVSDAVQILTDLNELLVIVTPPTVGLTEEEKAEEAAEGEPEVIERGKREEEDF